ncbi:MAG: MBL fold metallo-hydrolase [Proteobacteria bacterium]|nr:MBL fold metallo-hydrolase [Pseudomonadota bacterium]
MKITLIYDNYVFKAGLRADWGFACLVEVENVPPILFDTGANGSILLSNMRELSIDPAAIQEVFISHSHWDHLGGLPDFLDVKSNVKVYVPASCSPPPGAEEVISVSDPIQIHENIFSTGELKRVEQSMAIKTKNGVVLIVGCSHPGVGTILESASQFGKVYALIGGLHGFDDFDLLKDIDLVCPTHCTQHMREIKSLYPEKCIDGGAGKIITL